MTSVSGPTPADVRAMLRLSRALHTSNDAALRKKHLLAGMCDLLGAGSAQVVVAEVQTSRRRHKIISSARHGPGSMREEQVLSRCLPALSRLPRAAPAALGSERWSHLNWPPRPSRGPRVHHCLWRVLTRGDGRVVACLSLSRPAGNRRPFVARERLLLHLAHVEMSWVYEDDLLLAARGATSLSPRQRQTLQNLLGGHSEKEIAKKMRLSPNTVHHHVKALYKHFDVSSRGELLARWVR